MNKTITYIHEKLDILLNSEHYSRTEKRDTVLDICNAFSEKDVLIAKLSKEIRELKEARDQKTEKINGIINIINEKLDNTEKCIENLIDEKNTLIQTNASLRRSLGKYQCVHSKICSYRSIQLGG